MIFAIVCALITDTIFMGDTCCIVDFAGEAASVPAVKTRITTDDAFREYLRSKNKARISLNYIGNTLRTAVDELETVSSPAAFSD